MGFRGQGITRIFIPARRGHEDREVSGTGIYLSDARREVNEVHPGTFVPG
jgi:hypothetical protein